jgi:hypothetical protein
MKNTIAIAASLVVTGGALAQDAFSDAMRPITAPTVFDLALPRTQLHAIYLNQSMPSMISAGGGQVGLGGDFQVYALQFEYAFNERTSFVATKDGYIDFNPDQTLSSESGFADLGFGIKHALIYDPAQEFVLSGIATVEIPTGESEVWQGEGDGILNLNLSALKLCNKFQFAGNLGLHIPFSDAQSLTGSLSLHASYEVTPWFIPLIELNWFHTFDPGEGSLSYTNQLGNTVPSIVEFEAGDLINWGTQNADNNRDFVTLGLGFRSRLCEAATFGFAYEFPLTDEEDGLMDDRFTLDVVYKF